MFIDISFANTQQHIKTDMLWAALLELLALAPFLTLMAIVLWKRKRLDSDDRRSPITTDLRSLPGSSLQERFDKLLDSRIDKLVIALTAGLISALLIASRRMDLSTHGLDWIDAVFAIGSLLIALHLGRQIANEMPQQRKLRQAIHAEQATAQEIASSLAGDNRIINDVQAKGFNIDHVVITPAGVFAVETKSRLKPPTGNGNAAVKVRYDGKQLEFPGWTETKPIEQAARQARWLSDYLYQTTGESFPVIPVLAIPGWYVESSVRYAENAVRVINPKKSSWLFLAEKQPARLEASAIQRATSAIEKLAQAETA